jgi:hypothetical protein
VQRDHTSPTGLYILPFYRLIFVDKGGPGVNIAIIGLFRRPSMAFQAGGVIVQSNMKVSRAPSGAARGDRWFIASIRSTRSINQVGSILA